MFYLVSFIVCNLLAWLFASHVEGKWINPFADLKKEKKRREIDARYRAACAAYELEQDKIWQEWLQEKERRQLQAVETRRRQAERAAMKAAKRAAHQERTLANKIRKEQAREEYSLRKWGVPPDM